MVRRAKHGAEASGDPVRPVRNRLDRLADQLVKVLNDDVEGGEEARLLALEVLVEGAERNLGRSGDVGDRRLVVTAFVDDLGEAGDQSLALAVGDLVTREAVTTWRQRPELMVLLTGPHQEEHMWL
jgi:hypothetical protein